jgi:hypothetical protein
LFPYELLFLGRPLIKTLKKPSIVKTTLKKALESLEKKLYYPKKQNVLYVFS